jgi:L,D-transpeptidase ErfK/SrfK
MSRSMTYVLLILLGVWQSVCRAGSGEGLPALTGSQFSYNVVAGDYLEKIGARFGVSAVVLARDNGMPDPDRIFPGQQLRVDNRHIVPESLQNGIVINIPQRMLFFFLDGRLANSYPIGVGKPTWPTVQGSFRVADLEKNPVWLVPKSVQEEMAREGEVVKNKVTPGPDNPLGKFWIGLNAPGYGIHGTIAPASIYHFQSHGCIRLLRDDIAQLFPQVSKGLSVKLIYRPVLVAEENGHIFAEIHPDIYKRAHPALDEMHQLAAINHFTERIDWRQIQDDVLLKDGVSRDVTLEETKVGKQ